MTVVWGTNNSETLDQTDSATNFADTLLGLEGNDKLFGLKGDDWLKGGGGADELHGGDGVDWADYSDSTERVQVNLITGKGAKGYAEGDTYDSIENVWGSGYHDSIWGNNADNEIFGGGGNDSLMGGGGGDILDGGPSFDSVTYWSSPEAVFINLAAGTASGGDADDDTLLNIEAVGGSESVSYTHLTLPTKA